MKIRITEDMKRRSAKRPAQPAVSLSDDAYSALLTLSDKENVSMRKLASAIILEACNSTLEVEKVGAANENPDHL